MKKVKVMKKRVNKKIKKEGFFEKNCKQVWEFLKESKNYIWIAVSLFVISAVIGYLFPVFFEQDIIPFIKKLSYKTANMGVYELIVYIFLNNLRASFVSIIFGIGAGIFPVITAVSNGYLVGFVSKYVIAERGALVLWRLLPHGIFELPAVMISIGLGIKLGIVTVLKHNFEYIKKELKEDLRVFVFVVFPLLVIAGIIEGVLIFVLR